VTATYTQTT
jgi:hypothetical protein